MRQSLLAFIIDVHDSEFHIFLGCFNFLLFVLLIICQIHSGRRMIPLPRPSHPYLVFPTHTPAFPTLNHVLPTPIPPSSTSPTPPHPNPAHPALLYTNSQNGLSVRNAVSQGFKWGGQRLFQPKQTIPLDSKHSKFVENSGACKLSFWDVLLLLLIFFGWCACPSKTEEKGGGLVVKRE